LTFIAAVKRLIATHDFHDIPAAAWRRFGAGTDQKLTAVY
jgi:hypothetical protein